MSRIKVLLADDHAMFAEAMRTLLEQEFELVGVVHEGLGLLEAVEKTCPDVVVADISMPRLNGVDAVRRVKASYPDMKFVMLTMHAEPELAVEAFRAGASAYVLKMSPGEELVMAIGEAAKGRVYLTPLIAKDLISVLIEAKNGEPEKVGEKRLTPRQRQVLQLIAEGKTMKEVAALLSVSPRTAESHKYEMMEVLGVKTTAELIQHAIRMKLISIPEA